MSLTNLQRQWQHAANQLGLRVETPYSVRLPDGSSIEVEVHLHGYGARNGMLVLSDYAVIEEKKDAILAAGFGCSCYGPIPESEVTSLDGFDEILSDWTKIEEPNPPPEPIPPRRDGSS